MNLEDPVKPGQNGGEGSGPSGSGEAGGGSSSMALIEEEEEQYSEMEASDVIMVVLAYMLLIILFPLIFTSFRVSYTPSLSLHFTKKQTSQEWI